MKIRIASVMLAFGLTLSAATVAFASETGEVTGILQETQEQTEQTAQFYLDGEPLYGVVAESINGHVLRDSVLYAAADWTARHRGRKLRGGGCNSASCCG